MLRTTDVLPLLSLTAASVTAQVILTGGPIVAALLGSPPIAVTGLFTAMAMCRVPYLLLPGFSGKLSVVFTRLWVTDAKSAADRLFVVLLLAVATVPLLGGLIGWTAGDPLIRLLFGDVEVPTVTIVIVALASRVAARDRACPASARTTPTPGNSR